MIERILRALLLAFRGVTDTISMRPVPYVDQGVRLNGELYWPGTVVESFLPGIHDRGILLVHGGAGLDEHARDQARRYAGLGYIVFACDMYGEGVQGDRERIVACATALRDDPAMLVRRAMAGVHALSRCLDSGPESQSQSDAEAEAEGGVESDSDPDSGWAGTGHSGDAGRTAPFRIAAIGFCFGGMTTLALARSGANVLGAVSIHGSLATPAPAPPASPTGSVLKAKVLACHGAADPHVPMSDVVGFTDEMNRAAADWQLIVYGQAQHGFTHKHAAPGAIPGVAYHQAADERSFAAVRGFLAEVFGHGE